MAFFGGGCFAAFFKGGCFATFLEGEPGATALLAPYKNHHCMEGQKWFFKHLFICRGEFKLVSIGKNTSALSEMPFLGESIVRMATDLKAIILKLFILGKKLALKH